MIMGMWTSLYAQLSVIPNRVFCRTRLGDLLPDSCARRLITNMGMPGVPVSTRLEKAGCGNGKMIIKRAGHELDTYRKAVLGELAGHGDRRQTA